MDPPSGWVYEVENGMVIREGTFDKLVRSVRRHFTVNNYPIPPNLEAVIQDQMCRANPQSICEGEGPTRFFPSAKQIEEGTKKLLALSLEFSKVGDPMVPQEVADERARMCLGCPMKRNVWGCFVCTKLVELVTKTYGRSTPYDRDLYGCGVCGCVNAAQVHLDVKLLAKTAPEASVSDYPTAGCWKRTALETHYGLDHNDSDRTSEPRSDNASECVGGATEEPDRERGAGESDLQEADAGAVPAGEAPGEDQEPVGWEPSVHGIIEEEARTGLAE